MVAVQLTDKSGRWFDTETAIRLTERTWHDGSNQISANTGSQWSHEGLWCTRKGNWILEQDSDSSIRYTLLDDAVAIQWISHNDIYGDGDGEEFKLLPETVQRVIMVQLKGMEL